MTLASLDIAPFQADTGGKPRNQVNNEGVGNIPSELCVGAQSHVDASKDTSSSSTIAQSAQTHLAASHQPPVDLKKSEPPFDSNRMHEMRRAGNRRTASPVFQAGTRKCVHTRMPTRVCVSACNACTQGCHTSRAHVHVTRCTAAHCPLFYDPRIHKLNY